MCSFFHSLTQPNPLSLSLPRINLCSPYIATNDIARTAERFGYYLPWNLGGAAVAATGYGLMSMLKPTTPSSKWIGYQIIYGIGSGSMVSVVSSPLCFLRPSAHLTSFLII